MAVVVSDSLRCKVPEEQNTSQACSLALLGIALGISKTSVSNSSNQASAMHFCQSLSFTSCSSFFLTSNHNAQEVMFSSLSNLLNVPNLTRIAAGNSGVARTLRTSAFTRPTVAKRAFQPVKNNFAPALGARLATTSALDGKIHQVIGAVVDGTWSTPRSRALHLHYGCEALLAQTNTEA